MREFLKKICKSKMKITLINDQPLYSGMGKYAFKIFELLKDKFDLEFLFLDYKERAVKNKEKKLIVQDRKFPIVDNKPFFWYRIKNRLPASDIHHFSNQNLSFLISKTNSIVTCHDLAPLITPDHPAEKFWRRYLYQGLKRAKKILADSFSTKRDLMNIYGISEEKIKTIYLGVDCEIFKPLKEKHTLRQRLQIPDDFKVILNVGTEKYRKNIPGLLCAFGRLVGEGKNLVLIRVGRKSKFVQSLVTKMGLTNNLKYFEDVVEEELPIFYNASDIFVMPSFYEGFGLPALEAMSCGIPVVVSNTSSLPEIVGDAGIKVNPYSASEIYKGMKKLLYDSGFYSELKDKCLDQAKKFTWQKTAEGVTDVYNEVINE